MTVTSMAGSELEVILASVAEGITAVGADSRVTFANDIAAQMAGYSCVAEMLAAPPGDWLTRYELLREDGSPFPLGELPTRLAFDGHGAREALIRWRERATGVDRWTLLTARAVHQSDESQPRVVISVFRDVTERFRRDRAREAVSHAVAALTGDPESALRALARGVVPTLADFCVVHVERAHAEPIRIVAHEDPSKAAHAEQIDQRWPARRDEHIEALRTAGLGTSVTAAIRSRGEVQGALTFIGRAGTRRYDEADVELAEELASRIGVYLDGVRLLEETRAARDAAELLARRLETIAHTTRAIAEAGLDVERVLGTVARELCSVIGEGCTIRTLSDDGTQNVHRATAHRDTTLQTLAMSAALIAPRPAESGLFAEILRTSARIVVPVVERDAILADYAAAGITEHLDRLVPKTMAILPLIARGRTFGMIALSRHADDRPYDESELALGTEIASRAALAIDSAALHAAATRSSEERADALERAREASRAKDEFLAMLGHELRNPLAPIMGILQLRRTAADREPSAQDVTLERQVRHLAGLVCRRPPRSGGIGRELADLGVTSVAFVGNATTENERAQVTA